MTQWKLSKPTCFPWKISLTISHRWSVSCVFLCCCATWFCSWWKEQIWKLCRCLVMSGFRRFLMRFRNLFSKKYCESKKSFKKLENFRTSWSKFLSCWSTNDLLQQNSLRGFNRVQMQEPLKTLQRITRFYSKASISARKFPFILFIRKFIQDVRWAFFRSSSSLNSSSGASRVVKKYLQVEFSSMPIFFLQIFDGMLELHSLHLHPSTSLTYLISLSLSLSKVKINSKEVLVEVVVDFQ